MTTKLSSNICHFNNNMVFLNHFVYKNILCDYFSGANMISKDLRALIKLIGFIVYSVWFLCFVS